MSEVLTNACQGAMRAALCAVVLILAASSALALEPVGKVVAVKSSASAAGPGGKRALVAGGPIFMKDVISTGYFGGVQIIFEDETRLAIGPRARLVIDDLVYENKTTTSFVVSATSGAFRFISGKSAKSAYKINTPVANLGIRGTKFDVAVPRRSRTAVVLFEGQVIVCRNGGKCETLTNICDLALVGDGPEVLKGKTGNLPPGSFRLEFPFIRSEKGLTSSFRVGSARCDAGGGGGGSTPGGGGDDKGGNGTGGTEGGGTSG